METITNRSHCFRTDREQGGGRADQPIGEDEEKESINPSGAVYCKACGRTVTGKDRKIEIEGSHRHTFFNPAGIVFELGCFSSAPGCYPAGKTTPVFTWFSGYRWRFALCGGCNNHLGWSYKSAENSFFGLILSQLRE